MRVLVVGSGGREHALAWKLAESARVELVYVAPGNAGTAQESKCENIAIGSDDLEALTEFAAREPVAFTVVGPEAPIVAGIADRFRERGLRCLAPTAFGAQLEGSKSFAKEFMRQCGVPTAEFRAFTDLDDAVEYIRARGAPIVVKADGLAAGKGVVVARTVGEAVEAAESMLAGGRFGAAGESVVIEDFLRGEEASFIALCDGRTALAFAGSQDHKPAFDGDTGPNTGGMGAYSPAPVLTEQVCDRVQVRIIEPVLKGMFEAGHPYVGFLYAGLMITETGHPMVVEFNCRFGDPEAQPVLTRLDSDLASACLAALGGGLHESRLEFHDDSTVGVVLASDGYPGTYERGVRLDWNLDPTLPVKVFHAGTTLDNGHVVTSGGRVLCVVARGRDVATVRQTAYAAVEEIAWSSCMYRTDIGLRAIGRESGTR